MFHSIHYTTKPVTAGHPLASLPDTASDAQPMDVESRPGSPSWLAADSIPGFTTPKAKRTHLADRSIDTTDRRPVIQDSAAVPSRAVQARRQYDQAVMASLYLGVPVSDPDQLLQMIREGLCLQKEGVRVTAPMDAVRQRLQPQASGYPLHKLCSALSQENCHALFDAPLARLLLSQSPGCLRYLPDSLLTPEFLDHCIADNFRSAFFIHQRCPQHPIVAAPLLRSGADMVEFLGDNLRSQEIKKLAVRVDPSKIQCFAKDTDPGYSELCMIALGQKGSVLQYIPPERITAAMVDLALERQPIARIRDIPEALRSKKRCQKALLQAEPVNHPEAADTHYPEEPHYHFLHHWPALMKYRTRFFHWLDRLPMDQRTEKRCIQFMKQFPNAPLELIPPQILKKHPEWRTPAERPPVLEHYCVGVPDTLLQNEGPESRQMYRDFCNQNSAWLHLNARVIRPGIPPWALLRLPPGEQQRWLVLHLKEHLVRHGGPDGPAACWGAQVASISAEGLLCPTQRNLCPPEAARIPATVRDRLLFCRPFALRNQALGWQLQDQLEQHQEQVEPTLTTARLWQTNLQMAADWQVHGGRVLCHTEDSPCRRLKFLRAGEPLAEWLAEAAVQKFALQHKSHLGLKSEIPVPRGFWRVPVAFLPDPDAKGMKSGLAVQTDAGTSEHYYLAFECTTRDHDYNHLVWQTDAAGDDTRAEEGMKRIFYDLGVWASLGVLHSSTAMLSHGFFNEGGSTRPEIVLLHLLTANDFGMPGYPGPVGHWDTMATGQSDWGWSGLRDLGDVEFYGTLNRFMLWKDADWQYPSYGQRAAYMNIVCTNLLIGLLHYMRRNRDAPDWYYRNTVGCQRLAGWIDDRFTLFLQGLLGDDSRMEPLFPDAACYKAWLHNTAREILYWSARQYRRGEACFAGHLRETGRPCPSLYPGHPLFYRSYREDFTDRDDQDDLLGPRAGKLPLFSLVRGFYLMTYQLAERLEGPEPVGVESEAGCQAPHHSTRDSAASQSMESSEL